MVKPSMPRLIHAYFLDTAKWCSLQDRMTSLTKQNCSLVSGTLRNANGVLLYLFESMLKFNVRKGKFFLYSTCTSIFFYGIFYCHGWSFKVFHIYIYNVLHFIRDLIMFNISTCISGYYREFKHLKSKQH